MRQFATGILLAFFLLLLFAALTPLWIDKEDARFLLTAHLNRTFAKEFAISGLSWNWLPTPALTLHQTTITGERFTVTAPEVRLGPDWPALLRGELRPRTIVMIRPRLDLRSWETARGGMVPSLPAGTVIRIQEGRISIPVTEIHQPLLRTDTVVLDAVEGEVTGEAGGTSLELHAIAPFSDRLTVQGRHLTPGRTFELLVRSEGLQLHKTILSLVDGRLLPVESKVDLSGRLSGSGPDDFRLDLQGDFPCFLVKPGDRAVLFNCGVVDLTLARKNVDLELRIAKFKVKDPGITLTGLVSRKIPAAGGAPLWHLDLGAEEVDLAEVREAVFTLWGDSEPARIVCDTVRGGRADQATFRFDGPAADFRHIEAMAITAVGDKVKVHVPAAELDLQEASGPIAIRDGYLSGRELTARLDDSAGRNGSLLLDLTPRSRAFELDLDLDVDLAALPPILARLVHHPAFRAELARFSEVSGRAAGYLHLGETLDDLKVEVEVREMAAKGRYDRLRRPVAIREGRLRLAPGRLAWEGMGGEIGPHRFDGAAGAVAWESGEPLLEIGHFRATLDGRELYEELRDNDLLPDPVATKLAALDGVIRLDRLSFAGPVRLPARWIYDLELSTPGLTWQSPLLPEPVVAENGAATIRQDRISLSGARLRFLDQPLAVRGEFEHTLLHRWQGRLDLDVTVAERLGAWVLAQNWVPDLCRPRLPLTLRDFRLAWQDNLVTAVQGDIEAGGGGGGGGGGGDGRPAAGLHLDLRREPGREPGPGPDTLWIDELSIRDGEQRGRLTLERQGGPAGRLHFAWRGVVAATTVDRFLEKSGLLAGRLEGDFEALLAGGPEAEQRLTGQAVISDLRWRRPPGAVDLAIPALELSGRGDKLGVERLEVEAGGHRLSGQGTAVPALEGLLLDLELSGPSLAWETVAGLARERPGLAEATGPDERAGGEDGGAGIEAEAPEPPAGAKQPYPITGRVGFELDSFTSAVTARKIGGPEAPPYVWQPFRGELLLQPEAAFTVNIDQARLCCLEMTGSWRQDRDQEMTMELATAADCETPRFETLLPCLHIRQDIIEGECDLKARLQGSPGDWRRGSLAIDSRDGRILRLRMLSKIFKVVNLTDLFTSGDLPEVEDKGFPYTSLELAAEVGDNTLRIEKGVILAEGLNLYGNGRLDLKTLQSDFTIFIAPFKTLDTIIGKVPLVSRIMRGGNALVAIPVGVSGDIRDPEARVLAPEAVRDSALNLLRETLLLPFNILFPLLPGPDEAEPEGE